MATYGDTIEKVARYLMPRPPQTVSVLTAYTAASSTLILNGSSPSAQAVRPGSLLGIDLEVFYVSSVVGTGVASVTGSAVSLPLTVTTGSNDTFIYNYASATISQSFVVPPGTYSTLATLVTAVEAAVGSFAGEAFSTFVTVVPQGTGLLFTEVGNSQQGSGDYFAAGTHNVATALGIAGSGTTNFTDQLICTVAPGFQGSTEANHSVGAKVYINPRFTMFDISVAVNDEILSLSAPSCGLGQIDTVQITYIPTFDGYDLGSGFDAYSSYVLGVSYKIVAPTRRHPQIRRGDYRVIRNNVDGDFPSGNGIQLNNDRYGERAQVGFPITVIYLAPFATLVNWSDDLLSVGGIPLTCQDIVVMGAECRLASDREIQRNSTAAQPDPRKAPEVPAGAMRGATASLELRRQRRINEEADRIWKRYPNAESR